MKRVSLIALLIIISFYSSFAQMQSSVISPYNTVVQWQKNNINSKISPTSQKANQQLLKMK